MWAGLLDVIAALACIGTAIVLFPVVKRQNEAAALGFVAARVLEAGIIVVCVVSLLSVVTLRQDLAGAAGAASLAITGRSLVAFHDWTFLLGPGINDQISVWSAIAGIPMLFWEFSLGIWLVVKGFRPSPIMAGPAAARTPAAYRDIEA